MAIRVNFAGATIYKPGGSGMLVTPTNFPGYTRHESFIKIAHNNEDPGICLAFLRALVKARIISGVRCNDMIVFHINASVPNE